MTSSNTDAARALDTLSPDQLARVLKIVDAILETAPKERPPHWTEVPDSGYSPYTNGKAYMLWDVAQMLREAIAAPRPAADSAGEAGGGGRDDGEN